MKTAEEIDGFFFDRPHDCLLELVLVPGLDIMKKVKRDYAGTEFKRVVLLGNARPWEEKPGICVKAKFKYYWGDEYPPGRGTVEFETLDGYNMWLGIQHIRDYTVLQE